VAELIVRSPAAGLTPVEIGETRLTEAAMVPLWAIAPFRGQTDAVSRELQRAIGLPFPAPGALHGTETARIAWSGLDQALLMGIAPEAELAEHAALIDQSDAWTHLVLEGPAARDVLARSVPIDLSATACPPGSARRTLLGHMPALILHEGGDRFEVLVFRSMAGTAVHDLTRAMRAVAARAAI
jgi:sarcosine oxidase subunit gamma